MKLVFVFAVLTVGAGCNNRDVKIKEGDVESVFFEYTITADENLSDVTCMFQFKDGSVEGEAISIEPAIVKLDGEQINPDSARLSGFFYEVHKPIESFAGRHAIVVAAPDQKQYSNEFEFYPFTLTEELPEKVNRKPFVIRLKNFPASETEIRLLMLDTSFTSAGFNEMVPVRNGEVVVDLDVLENLKNGPVNFELYLEKEQSLKQVTQAGGRISITYGLKREFELVN